MGATGSLKGQQAEVCQARLVLCCLDGEKVVGSDDNSVLASFDCSTKLLCQHFRCCLAKLIHSTAAFILD